MWYETEEKSEEKQCGDLTYYYDPLFNACPTSYPLLKDSCQQAIVKCHETFHYENICLLSISSISLRYNDQYSTQLTLHATSQVRVFTRSPSRTLPIYLKGGSQKR
jgi:hypothetical protein